MSIASRIGIFGLCVALCAAPAAGGAVLDSQNFDQPFKIVGNGNTVWADSGTLYIGSPTAGVTSTYEVPGPGAGVAFSVSAAVSEAVGSPGSFNVGLTVGSNNVVFHPGYTPTPGALRVEGTGGFGNQDVGFVPAMGVLHPLTVTGDGAGNFTVTLEDGLGVAPAYTTSWSNPSNTVSTLALRRSGPTALSGMFDDFAAPGLAVQGFNQNFTTTANGQVQSAGGQLILKYAGSNNFLFDGQAGDLLIGADIGSTPGSGNTNVGLRIGGNNIVFHPSYSGGALRVEGPGGFGNTNVGFDPAGGGVMHHMEVAVNAATGLFTVALQNGANPGNVYVARFTNTGYAPLSDKIGFRYGSGLGDDEGRFDNYQASQLTSAQGPAGWLAAVQASAPLHWYRLSDAGSLIAADSGSAAWHGTYHVPVSINQPGLMDGAAQFDGTTGRVDIGLDALGGPWTAEFVVKRTAQETSGVLLAGSGYAIKLDQHNNTGRIGFTHYTVLDYLFDPAAVAEIGEWEYITITGNPVSGLTLFMDGVPVASSSVYIPLPRYNIGGGEVANMLLDEVILYDRILSHDEIQWHAVQGGFDVPEPLSMVLLLTALPAAAMRARRRMPAR